jgi:hypothetical protein
MRSTLILSALLFTSPASSSVEQEKPLRDAVWNGRWLEGVRLYSRLDGPSPQASYLAGLAQWKLRRPEDAQPLLKKAADAGFHSSGGRPQPADLLARIDDYLSLRPKKIELPGLEVYAEERTPRTAPVIDAVPRVAEIGKTVFGDAPAVRWFLFARLSAFKKFYAVFDDARNESAAHSTGMVGTVLFCEEKAHRKTTDETASLVLHETMHAWAATYLRQKFDRPVFLPAYADEGLATYVAGLWSPEVGTLPAERLARWRKRGITPPSFEELRKNSSFREADQVLANYWLSEQFIERLIGPPSTGSAKIKAFLDAFGRTGDDLKAWREVSGKDPAAEYAALAAGD